MAKLMRKTKRIASKIRRETYRLRWKMLRHQIFVDYMGLKLRLPLMSDLERRLMVPDEYWMSHCLGILMAMRDGAVVDVGANAGVYLAKVKAVDAGRPYVGFEPNPLCYAYLSELIRVNRFSRTSVFPVALGGENAVQVLFANKMGDPTGSLVNEGIGTGDFSTLVLVRTGDEVLSLVGLDRIGVIKIDVEGVEDAVVFGLRNTIRRYKPLIYCEVLPPALRALCDREADARRAELLLRLRELSYSVIGFSPAHAPKLVNEVGEFSDKLLSEFVFLPDEDVEEFRHQLTKRPFELPMGAKV